MVSFIDLFAGAGGWSSGFNLPQYKHLGMYDHNPSACKTAEFNFGPIVSCVDLFDHHKIEFPKTDLVIGSPPCQGFSNEGKKNPDDPRNSLVWAYFDIVERISPQVWVFENVPGFKRSYGGKWFNAVSDRINKMGYHWVSGILNAANYGVPQNRQRFVIIAAKDFRPNLPPITHTGKGGLFGEKPFVSLWDAISDLPIPRPGDRIGEYQYLRPPTNGFQNLIRIGSKVVSNHTAQKHSERVVEKIKSVPIGGNMEDFINNFPENSTSYEGGYRRATKDAPSWTAYWTRGMTSIHPEQDRFLTPRECARIQSFPDTHVFKGTTIENYTQICNAVPPLLANAIAQSVLTQIQKSKASIVGSGELVVRR